VVSLYVFDRNIAGAQGVSALCGVDEAGRGPLAGPVYAAAVILPLDEEIQGIDDSKKLTAKKREALYPQILRQAVCYAIATATPAEIDRLNILQATMLAMRRAVQALGVRPDRVLVDGNRAPELDIPAQTVVKGDALSAGIAAASILAKVSRDRYMDEMESAYPGYQFAKHKGYPTKLHFEALDALGPSDIHRRSFLVKWERKKQHEV